MAAKESKVCDETHQVLEKFKCDVCGIGPRPEKMSWYKCLDGHAICQDCRIKYNCLGHECQPCPGLGHDAKCPVVKRYIGPVEFEDDDSYWYCCEPILPGPCKMIAALLSMKTMRFECINEDKGCKKLLVFWTKKL